MGRVCWARSLRLPFVVGMAGLGKTSVLNLSARFMRNLASVLLEGRKMLADKLVTKRAGQPAANRLGSEYG